MAENLVPNKYQPEILTRNRDDWPAQPMETRVLWAMVAIGLGQSFVRSAIVSKLGQFDPESIAGHIAYNSGDFGNGYSVSFITELALRVISRKMSPNLRRVISSGAGVAAVILAETSQLSHGYLGTPDPADIPAGLIGVACYLGVSLWLNRNTVNKQSTKEFTSPASIDLSFMPRSDIDNRRPLTPGAKMFVERITEAEQKGTNSPYIRNGHTVKHEGEYFFVFDSLGQKQAHLRIYPGTVQYVSGDGRYYFADVGGQSRAIGDADAIAALPIDIMQLAKDLSRFP